MISYKNLYKNLYKNFKIFHLEFKTKQAVIE